MKKIARLSFILLTLLTFSAAIAQTSPVKITVRWDEASYLNKVEVYDPANSLIISICNPEDCYTSSGALNNYSAIYDLGCVQDASNYYLRLFNADDTAWIDDSNDTSFVKVEIDGVEIIDNDGSNASDTGFDIFFDVTGGSASCASFPDTDQDNVIDLLDQDDDNDGILDVNEGLGINNFNCDIPALDFFGGFYDAAASSGPDLSVGAVYRFVNALIGYDVLIEVMSINGCTLVQMDDDTVDNPNYLQTRIEFIDSGTPGIDFRFTIVDTGTTTPTSTLFRIGGTSWDVDGQGNKESVIYRNPSAYGADNPTALETLDLGGGDIQVTSAGILEGSGFSTLPELRSYFQFLNNTFDLRMQLVRSFSSTVEREFGMSFTQCDVFDFKSVALVITNGEDTDGDGDDNQVDIDSDNDGIPDNVEAQPTTTYIAPNNAVDALSGVDTAYATEITLTDTDNDGTPDFLDSDSDNDGTPDIEENGMANAIVTFTDTDNDGLDDLFEGANTSDPIDVNDEIDNPSSSILPDADGDLLTGGDLDYRDATDFGSASVDFDGVDDYLQAGEVLDLSTSDFTMSAWVKLDSNAGNFCIMGRSFSDFDGNNPLNRGITLEAQFGTTSRPSELYFVINNSSSVRVVSTTTDAIPKDKWVHVTATYDGTNIKLYVNGELLVTTPITRSSLPDLTGIDFTIGGKFIEDGTDTRNHFDGAIDEVRVFDMALTDDQIQRMVYQEIEQDGSNVHGTVTDKDIVDISTGTTIPWTNLQAYYPMTNIASSKTGDLSSYGRDATLRNITTVQQQSAPMPYESATDGSWADESTWLHGDVWDITGSVSSRAVSTIKNWAIVRVRSNVSVPFSVKSLGMIIDSGNTLTVTGDNFIDNTWYFALNGTLDLSGDSQLIQGVNSDLVTSAAGRILRRQEGNANAYWYNYWSSPVGSVGATSLTNNNGPGNNTNNSTFNIGMLEDGIGAAVEFTSAFNEVGKISNRWLYSFQNGQTYYGWIALSPASAILPGVGYTQKGTGNAGTEQQYTFNGKPNNGTILVSADDVEGDSGNESEQDVTLTTTMVGNPYPSALDADEFIRDNTDFANGGANPIIGGTILLWEQWAGNSHNLADYQGGYGYINLTETARAYQHPDIPIAGQTQTQGIKTPTKFLPVGQGFFVEVVNDGNIEFNNSQRVFKEETLGESVFFRSTPEAAVARTQRNADATDTAMQIIKLEFGVSNGATRRFVLGFSDDTTDGFDYGYDGGLITTSPGEDMTSLLGDQQFVIQAMSPITEDKVIDLNLQTSGTYTYSLDIVDIKNIDTNQAIYLRDHQEDVYWDLRDGAYSFTATGGTDSDRFDIVFKNDQTLSNDDVLLEGTVIFANSKEHKLYVKGLEATVKTLTLTNMLGQRVKVFQSPETNTLENGLYIGELSSGVYLVNLITETNSKLNKKIILE